LDEIISRKRQLAGTHDAVCDLVTKVRQFGLNKVHQVLAPAFWWEHLTECKTIPFTMNGEDPELLHRAMKVSALPQNSQAELAVRADHA